MSETSILPGAAPSTSDGAEVPVPPEFDSGEGAGDRRRLMIIGAVVAVVVVVVAAFLLLHKGSSSSNGTFVPHSTKPAPPTSSTTTHQQAAPPARTGQVLPKTSKRQVVRDPFNPLVQPPAAATGSTQSGPTTTVSPPATVPSSGPSTAPVVIPSGQPSSVPSTNPVVPAGKPLWIQLVSTNGDRSATFDVGYAHHKFHRFKVLAPGPTSTQGTVFDKVFALLGIQNGQVTLQIGDATPFDLTQGVTHSV